jgi:hypothetical protein
MFFFAVLFFYYTNTYFRSTYHVKTVAAAATATEARDAIQRVSSCFYFYYYTNDYFRLIYMRMKAGINEGSRRIASRALRYVLSLYIYITILISI